MRDILILKKLEILNHIYRKAVKIVMLESNINILIKIL